MNNNQPNTWRSLGFMLALAFVLGLSAYLTLTAAAAAQPKFVLPLEHWRQQVNFINGLATLPFTLTLTDPPAGTINTAATLTATVTPTTTILPISDTRQATELSQLTPTTTTLSYTVYLPIIFTPPSLIDNFDDGQDPNALGGYSSFAWYTPCPRTINGDYDSFNAYSGAYGYYLSYNVTPICYGVWQTDLRDQNYSGFSILTFWIKGASGGEQPHIYLQDSDNCQPVECRHFVNVTSYLQPAGQVTTGWKQARIPLSVFAANEVNLTRLRFFQVVFEYDNMAGTVYIDEIRFQ